MKKETESQTEKNKKYLTFNIGILINSLCLTCFYIFTKNYPEIFKNLFNIENLLTTFKNLNFITNFIFLLLYILKPIIYPENKVSIMVFIIPIITIGTNNIIIGLSQDKTSLYSLEIFLNISTIIFLYYTVQKVSKNKF